MNTSLPRPIFGPPASYGGEPAFAETLRVVRPSVPDLEAVAADVQRILASGVLTNGAYVQELERRASEYLDVRHCVAVASCTSGLMLVLRALDVSGDAVLPSFTFAATAHAAAWNGLRPVFADIDPSTLTLSPESADRASGVRTSVILATHTYGTPAQVEELEALAHSGGIRLVLDAAHAFGSRRGDVPIGRFGDAEVFSLSATKVLVAGEGGIIATNDDVLAERCRIGRDYGNPGDYDCRFVGLNARMSEVHAAIALASLDGLDDRIDRRNRLATWYHEALGAIPGISFPTVSDGDRSTFKDLTILVDRGAFGLDAAGLSSALADEGVETRRYYSPPVHAMRAYGPRMGANLPVTDAAAERVLTLPMWSDMTVEQVGRVAEAIHRIHAFASGEPRTYTLPEASSVPSATTQAAVRSAPRSARGQ